MHGYNPVIKKNAIKYKIHGDTVFEGYLHRGFIMHS